MPNEVGYAINRDAIMSDLQNQAKSMRRSAIDKLHPAARAGRTFDSQRTPELPGETAYQAQSRGAPVRLPEIESRSIILDSELE
jgi:hypothetical protein